MRTSRTLGLVMIAPAALMILLFFLMPVVLTAVFSFTSMTTATGISGGAYQVTPNSLIALKDEMPDVVQQLTEPRYVIDEDGIKGLEGLGLEPGIAKELHEKHLGEVFPSRREAERMIKDLEDRPSTREVKQISEQFNRSVANLRFSNKEELFASLDKFGIKMTPEQKESLAKATYTGWSWTTENFSRIASSPDMAQVLFNTLLYVALVLVLFNTSYAMLLAIWTHYMPDAPAAIFRSVWLLPRITPVVIYVLMWKWLAWDTGFISTLMSKFGYPPKNYLLDNAYNAWFFVVLINGFIGASMGMLVFSSALKAIPKSQFFASEVDGASRWQQIRYIILPQMRWPILFVTCYQTLSLLASFNEILLSTRGGPGKATEVWSLAAYHTALNNYAGNLEYGLGAAMALVLVAIGIILSLAYLRVFNYAALVARPLIED
ncbi:sugar ABC transporter permease [Rhizobium sp. P32RR-XVIII]|uniref:carbohydrate ABC transporter permease n=1 Tax=Rhizobium sp. P32RR-XVIII TaxID=2726738 RepID=UPI001456E8B5|nr:sugar ABC transporter permease [Rhizobium sp. P32RR-XVIII]NLS06978.1 sugar ABC transporter permease [Rhizobium sp. P32RR-XVIII]